MTTPRPDGWKGGSEDFTFLRTFQGRLGINVNSEESELEDMARQNPMTKPDESGDM